MMFDQPLTRSQFVDRIKESRPLLMDGAVGTALYNMGVPLDKPIELLNLDSPRLVADIHRAYIEAGSDIIETNSFSANRFKLNKFGQGGRVSEINSAGVTIARRVINSSFKPVLLAGSVGPLAVSIAPLGRVSIQQVRAAFTEQITSLIDPISGEQGVDLLLIETMSNLQELRTAVEVARIIRPDIPIVVQMTFHQDDRTQEGYTAEEVAWQLERLDVEVIGINCSSGPAQIFRLLQKFPKNKIPYLAASPNAGWPEDIEGDRVLYPAGPYYFRQYVAAYEKLGVNLIGGCCGTSPEHIRHMRSALDQPIQEEVALPEFSTSAVEERVERSSERPTKLAQALTGEEFIKLAEMTPPRGVGLQKMCTAAQSLVDAGANYLLINDLPQARMRMSAWGAGFQIQQQVGTEVILQMPTRGRSLVRLQADLLAIHALGLRNIVVILGDRNRDREPTTAENTYDLMPDGLIKLIRDQLNTGQVVNDQALEQPTNFTVGCSINITPANLQREARLLHEFSSNGADFALTKPVYDFEAAANFIEHYTERFGPPPPIIATVHPLYNASMVDYLHNEIPGVFIPDRVQQMMRTSPFPQDTGIQLAQDLMYQLQDLVRGVCLTPYQNRYDLISDVLMEAGDNLFEDELE